MLPAPANDLKTRALDLPLPPGDESLNIEPLHLDSETIAGANHDGMAACGRTETEPDVWYHFTAPSTGRFNITTNGTWEMWGANIIGMDTVLSLHRPDGTPIPGLCNDDMDSFNRDSLLEWPLLRGEEVLVRVSRFGDSPGTTFMLTANLFPPELACIFDFDRDGDLDGLDLAKFAEYFQANDLKLDINWNSAIDDDDFTAMSDDFARPACAQ